MATRGIAKEIAEACKELKKVQFKTAMFSTMATLQRACMEALPEEQALVRVGEALLDFMAAVRERAEEAVVVLPMSSASTGDGGPLEAALVGALDDAAHSLVDDSMVTTVDLQRISEQLPNAVRREPLTEVANAIYRTLLAFAFVKNPPMGARAAVAQFDLPLRRGPVTRSISRALSETTSRRSVHISMTPSKQIFDRDQPSATVRPASVSTRGGGRGMKGILRKPRGGGAGAPSASTRTAPSSSTATMRGRGGRGRGRPACNVPRTPSKRSALSPSTSPGPRAGRGWAATSRSPSSAPASKKMKSVPSSAVSVDKLFDVDRSMMVLIAEEHQLFFCGIVFPITVKDVVSYMKYHHPNVGFFFICNSCGNCYTSAGPIRAHYMKIENGCRKGRAVFELMPSSRPAFSHPATSDQPTLHSKASLTFTPKTTSSPPASQGLLARSRQSDALLLRNLQTPAIKKEEKQDEDDELAPTLPKPLCEDELVDVEN